MNSSFTEIKRELRKVWEDEETELSYESQIYAKNRMSLREYLINVATSGYAVNVSTDHTNYRGYISEIGRDYFCINNTEVKKCIVLRLNKSISDQITGLKEINISEQKIEGSNFEQSDFNFKAKLSEICDMNDQLEVITVSQHSELGYVDFYKDFVCIANDEKNRNTKLVSPNNRLIPMSNLLGIVHKLRED